MVTIRESQTDVRDDAFIEDDYVRIDGGLITEIESVEEHSVPGHPSHIRLTVSQSEISATWSYKKANLATWDEEKCWLVEFAKERGYSLENLDELEGEPVYIHHSDDEWLMSSEHPREKFDDDEIEDSVSIEGRETLESLTEVTADEEVEMDCMEYETVGDYFVCEIEKMDEIKRDGNCNIIELIVDTPYDTGTWKFRKPYAWDEDNPLVQLAESRNYGRGNFTSLVGDTVLVARDGNEWTLNTERPSEYNKSTDTIHQTQKLSEQMSDELVVSILIIFVVLVTGLLIIGF